MSTPYIIVCADTYEFIYPSQLYPALLAAGTTSAIMDIEAGILGTADLPTKALALLTSSPQTTELNGGPIRESYTGIVGRWFNSRVCILTKGKLFNNLTAQAEGAIAQAKLKALTTTDEEDDFLAESIMDLITVPDMTEKDDAEDPDAAEETAEDKEEFIPKEQEYTNISDLVLKFLEGNKMTAPNPRADCVEVTLDTAKVTEKIKCIKLLREFGVAPDGLGLGLVEAKDMCEAAVHPSNIHATVTIFVRDAKVRDFLTQAKLLGCSVDIKPPIAKAKPATDVPPILLRTDATVADIDATPTPDPVMSAINAELLKAAEAKAEAEEPTMKTRTKSTTKSASKAEVAGLAAALTEDEREVEDALRAVAEALKGV